MSDWHKNLPAEKARQQIAMADRIREHFHVCRACSTPYDGPLYFDCLPGSPTLHSLCPDCRPDFRNKTAPTPTG